MRLEKRSSPAISSGLSIARKRSISAARSTASACAAIRHLRQIFLFSEYSSDTLVLSVVSILAVFTEEMLVTDAVRCRFYLRIDQFGLECHLCHFFQYHCVVYGFCSILAPCERSVIGAQYARSIQRVQPQFLKVSMITRPVLVSYAPLISSGVRLLAQGISP